MYRTQKANKTQMRVNQGYKGETIEQKIRRIVNNKEPIKDGAPLIYTERKDGVLPDYNIRNDKWEAAIDAQSKIDKANKLRRLENSKTEAQKEAEKLAKAAKEGMNKEGEA